MLGSTMFQDPATQTVNPLTGFAMGIGHAIGVAAMVFVSILVAAVALASMTLLWVGQRWPSFGNSLIANCAGGVVLTIALSWLITIVMGLVGRVIDLNGIYGAMPLAALALMLLMIILQWRARATFSRARLAGVVCAVLTPIVWITIFNVFS